MRTFQKIHPLEDINVVKRHFDIPSLADSQQGDRISRLLENINGVYKVSVNTEKNRLSVWYNILNTGYTALLKLLEDSDISVKQGMLFHIKRNFIEYTEQNMRENAKAPPPLCCNKPPK